MTAYTPSQYITDMLRTLAGDKATQLHLISPDHVEGLFGAVEVAAEDLDKLKKLIFYGREIPEGIRHDWSPNHGLVSMDIIHGAIGCATEAGELITAISEPLFHQRPLDRHNMIEEMGDVMWYMALLCYALNVSLEEVMQTNIAKLKKRYPEKFTSEAANNRDLVGERAVLEAQS